MGKNDSWEINYMLTKDEVIKNIDKFYDVIVNNLDWELQRLIEKELYASGIMCRVFSRKKTKESIIDKMENKIDTKYLPQNLKMQDLIGIRIVLYFKDDIDICINILKSLYIMSSCEHDRFDAETFKPQRINYIFEIPSNLNGINEEIQQLCLIDNTFEVQIRTIFSEGWHEVEHDIRYKYFDDWSGEEELSRELNGIFAVLEVCDNDIISICENMAYCKYKEHKWEAMIRNKFRLKFQHNPLRNELKILLDTNISEIGKEIFRYNRNDLIKLFNETRVPRTYDNVVYLINAADLHREDIYNLTPESIRRKCENSIHK